MHYFIMEEDNKLQDVILDRTPIPMKKVIEGETMTLVSRTLKEYDKADQKKIEKNFKAKKLFVYRIRPNESNRIFACESTKKIWDCLRSAHEKTSQVKDPKMDILTIQYKVIMIKETEIIQEMHTKFTATTNQQQYLREVIKPSEQVGKILGVLLKSQESKVNAITKARDLNTLTMDQLIGNLKLMKSKTNKNMRRRNLINRKLKLLRLQIRLL